MLSNLHEKISIALHLYLVFIINSLNHIILFNFIMRCIDLTVETILYIIQDIRPGAVLPLPPQSKLEHMSGLNPYFRCIWPNPVAH